MLSSNNKNEKRASDLGEDSVVGDVMRGEHDTPEANGDVESDATSIVDLEDPKAESSSKITKKSKQPAFLVPVMIGAVLVMATIFGMLFWPTDELPEVEIAVPEVESVEAESAESVSEEPESEEPVARDPTPEQSREPTPEPVREATPVPAVVSTPPPKEEEKEESKKVENLGKHCNPWSTCWHNACGMGRFGSIAAPILGTAFIIMGTTGEKESLRLNIPDGADEALAGEWNAKFDAAKRTRGFNIEEFEAQEGFPENFEVEQFTDTSPVWMIVGLGIFVLAIYVIVLTTCQCSKGCWNRLGNHDPKTGKAPTCCF